MSLKDGTVYDKSFIFDNEHLLTLTPEDVVAYFNLKVYGTPDPDEEACPRYGRSSSLCLQEGYQLLYAEQVVGVERADHERQSYEISLSERSN